MGSDRARISYDYNQQYRGVVAQQGRVTLEADWNEAQQIASEELREETLDFVGPSGTSDNGYEVIDYKVIDPKNPSAPFDFAARNGTMYVGGVRAFTGSAIKYSNQTDWLDYEGDPDWVALKKVSSSRELVYLLLREQEVSAVEDSALLEKALGGPDTTQRLRLIQHIVRLQTKGENCSSALDEAIETWREKKGLQLDPSTLRLSSATTLQVSFAPPPTPVDLCEPEARSGYLEADNQLIRVQIIDFDPKTNRGKLVWGFDNATFLYQAEVVDQTTLRLIKPRPVDDFHRPALNQTVEVLRSAAQLHNKEYIASATGLVTTLTTAYNPDTREVSLATALPTEYQNTTQSPRLFLRVWERTEDFTPGVPVSLAETGLQVTLSTSNQLWHIGDYWQIAVRTGEPTEVHPKRYREAPQPPDGPRLWACPLAVIGWNDGRLKVLQDCREQFDDLVKLTKRQSGGCCTVVVKPEDLTDTTTLQSIIDRFASRERPNRDHITICLMPGTYLLPRSLELDPQHSNFTLEGCGDGAELQAEQGQEVNFLHGLIVLNRADYVTLRNLRFQLPIVPFVKAGGNLTPFNPLTGNDQAIFGAQFQQQLRVSIGVRPLHCALLTIESCLFRFSIEESIKLFAVGIFAGSECWGLKLIENRFLSKKEYLFTNQQGEVHAMAGYLLSPSLIPTPEENQFKIVLSLIQDAVIHNNHFTGLSDAMLAIADTGMLRIEGNVVLDCIFGFWLAPIELRGLVITQPVYLLGTLFPLPKSFDVRELTQNWTADPKFDEANIPGIDRLLPSLHISSNDIDTRVKNGSNILSQPGLVIAGNMRKEGQIAALSRSRNSSVLLTANKIRSIPEPTNNIIQGAVFISNLGLCTVTGNLIINDSTSRQPPRQSLIIDPQFNPDILVAITGNVFQGIPVLPTRSGTSASAPPMNDWAFLNTVVP